LPESAVKSYYISSTCIQCK